MSSQLRHHLSYSILLLHNLQQTASAKIPALSTHLSDYTMSALLSISSEYASLPRTLPPPTRSNLHALFRELEKSLLRCNKRLSSISRSRNHRLCKTIPTALFTRRVRTFRKSLKRLDACIASIETTFKQIDAAYPAHTTDDPSQTSARPITGRNDADNRSTVPPANVARTGDAVMKAVGKGVAVIAREVRGSGDAGRASLTRIGTTPKRGVAGLDQLEAGRKRRLWRGGTRTQAWGEAVVAQAAVQDRAGNAVGNMGRRMERHLQGIVTAVCVGVYAMWILVLVVVIAWKRGGWMR